jgi:hypothetical protein
MNFLALNDDAKFIIATHLASDLKIRTLYVYLSTHLSIDVYLIIYLNIHIGMYVCIIRMYIRTCYVLTNPPIPSSRSKYFVVLRPV